MVQALAVLTTVGEAAARWAVARAQSRAATAERRAQAEQVSTAAKQQTDRVNAAVRAERRASRVGVITQR